MLRGSLLLFVVCGALLLHHSLISSVEGQSCRLASKLPEDDLTDACRPYLHNPRFLIYANDTFDTEPVQTQTYQALNSFKLLSADCRTAALRLFCPLFFLPCSHADLLSPGIPWPAVVPVPILPCREICDRTEEACESEFASLGVQIPNCSTFPEKIFEVPSLGFSAKCWNQTLNMDFDQEWRCPNPLQYSPEEDNSCVLRCPDPSYSADERNGLVWLTRILSTINIPMLLFLIIPYLAIPSRRAFPHQQLTQTFLAALLGNIQTISLWKSHHESFICVDGNLPATQFNSAECAFWGFWGTWISLVNAQWWLNLIINLFVAVVLETTMPLAGFIFLFCVAWFAPLAVSIVAASTGTIGYGGSTSHFCGFNSSLSTWLSSVPLTVVYGIAVILLPPIGWKMGKLLYFVVSQPGQRPTLGSKSRQNLRILTFALYYLIAVGLIIGLIWYGYDYHDHLLDGYSSWVTCSIVTRNSDQCKNDTRLSYGYILLSTIFTEIGSIVLFIVFGLGHTLTWFWWKRLLTTGRLPDPKDVELLTTTASRSSQVGGKRSSGTSSKLRSTD